MKEVLPFAAFAFFGVLIWARGGGGRRPSLRPDPPVANGADAFAFYGFVAAWAVGLVGILARLSPLIAVAGATLVAIGVVLAMNAGGALDLYSERLRRYVRRPPSRAGFTVAIVPYAILLIGAIWLVLGLVSALR